MLCNLYRLTDDPDFPGKRALFGRQRDKDDRVSTGEVRNENKDANDRKDKSWSTKCQESTPTISSVTLGFGVPSKILFTIVAGILKWAIVIRWAVPLQH